MELTIRAGHTLGFPLRRYGSLAGFELDPDELARFLATEQLREQQDGIAYGLLGPVTTEELQ